MVEALFVLLIYVGVWAVGLWILWSFTEDLW